MQMLFICNVAGLVSDYSTSTTTTTLLLHCSLAHSPRVSLSHYTRLSLSDHTRDLCFHTLEAGLIFKIEDYLGGKGEGEGAGHRGVCGISPKGNEDPAAILGKFLKICVELKW